MKFSILAIVFAFGLMAKAQTNKTVFPIGFEDENGNSAENTFSGLVPTYQQLFRASSLTPAWPTPVKITGVAFRVADGASSSFDAVIRDLDIRLSTTPVTPEFMNSSYFANRGTDELSVFSRENIAIFATGGLPQNPFEVKFTFDSPFVYDPSSGNLLMYIANNGPSGAPTPREQALDAHTFGALDSTTPFASVRGSGVSNARGLVAEFAWVAVPEPGVLTLIGIGVGLIGCAARCRQRF